VDGKEAMARGARGVGLVVGVEGWEGKMAVQVG